MKTETYSPENSITPTGKTSTCHNCGTVVTGQFCADCGQRYPQSRLTMKELLHLAYESVFDFDRGFFFTMKELFLHPHQVIHNYWQGKRVVYTNPIKYLLIWLGLSTFIGLSILDVDTFTRQMTQEMHLPQGHESTAEFSAKQARIQEQTAQIQRMTIQNPQFMYVVLVPLLSVCSIWMFRKKRNTYAEHLVMDTYLMAQTTIITIPVYVLFMIFKEHLMLVAMVSSLMAAGYYACITMFVFQGKTGALIKGLLAYVLSYLIFIFMVGIAGGIYAMVMIAK